MSKNHFGELFAIAILLFLTIGCSRDTEPNRSIKNIYLKDSIELVKPLKRFEVSGNYIYCYDFYDKSLLKLSKEFKILDNLGKWGEGPKENLLVRNYHILADNKLSIFDTEKHTFKIQDFNDSVYYYRKFSVPVERGVQIDDANLILVATEKGIRLNYKNFNILKDSYNDINEINDLFIDENSALVHEGKLIVAGTRLIHTSYFSDLWFTYDLSQDKLTTSNYLYRFDIPKVIKFGVGVMLDNSPALIADSFILNDFLAIISNVSEPDFPENRVLDLYDLDNMKYVKSYTLPDLNGTKPSEGFQFNKNEVGLIYEDKIYLFGIK